MARGVKTGGRQKGVPNRATAARQRAIEESGLSPLVYMLSVMRDEGAEEAVRLDAAKAAAPYIHPKLSAIEVSGSLTLNHEQALDELE